MHCRTVSLLLLLLHSMLGSTSPAEEKSRGLTLEQVGTEDVYFAYHGKPLLSFGGLSDFVFYAAEDAYDLESWVTWAAEHGMNHVRAYPPLSWRHQVAFARLNGGHADHVIFPYQETSPGSRQFDLTRFNPRYWQRMRDQLAYLEKNGIIVHLLMWNGWQLRTSQSHASPTAEFDWSGHFFHPANNINDFTDHLGPDDALRFQIYHSVADKNEPLVAAQQAWFQQLAKTAADFDNVYFDLVHEMAEHGGEWPKTQQWIKRMAEATRQGFRQASGRECILGMDTGGLPPQQRQWIFERPFFDLLIYGKKHLVANAWDWRREFKKPYIPQESWDEDGTKYRLIYREDHPHIRKYMWKFMMAKCQQLDLYIKPLRRKGDEKLAPWPHNYDPRGKNGFEHDATVLRAFWDSLTDFPHLRRAGQIISAPASQRYLLASPREAVLYFCSPTAKAQVNFAAAEVKLKGLPLAPGIDYRLRLWRPAGAPEASDSVAGPELDRQITVHPGGQVSFLLPEFTDDFAAHIAPVNGLATVARRARSPLSFERQVLTHHYYCDGITSGDINGDALPDIIAGPYWYQGPGFQQAHSFYPVESLLPERSPSNSMFSFVWDFSGDGWLDILVLGRVHKHEARWFENPGPARGRWEEHYAFERVRGESPTLVDVDGDQRPELLTHWEGRWGWLRPDWSNPTARWQFTAIEASGDWPQFYHGQGIGDVNGDQRLDLLINDGWYAQPQDPQQDWLRHQGKFSTDRGGAQMFVDDVDGDGDQDVITALNAHGWGLAWMERLSSDQSSELPVREIGDHRFAVHTIMGTREEETKYGVAFSQPHALALEDLDGDGHRDIVTGKRIWAHGPSGDVEPNAAPVIYWFQWTQRADGQIHFVPHRVDARSGVGVQVHVADVNGDQRPDILTASKLGAFVFLNREEAK